MAHTGVLHAIARHPRSSEQPSFRHSGQLHQRRTGRPTSPLLQCGRSTRNQRYRALESSQLLCREIQDRDYLARQGLGALVASVSLQGRWQSIL